jgi:uncharacterized caspase-like protein
LLSESDSDDFVLLYFSCHGIKDDAGRLYFAASNTLSTRLASTAVSAAFVAQQLEDSRCRKILALLDCCYSGAFIRGFSTRSTSRVDIEERLQGAGRVIITASTSTEYAFEASGEEIASDPVPSIFTSAVVKGIDSGLADRDSDGLVSVDELYDFVLDEVRAQTPRQTPSRCPIPQVRCLSRRFAALLAVMRRREQDYPTYCWPLAQDLRTIEPYRCHRYFVLPRCPTMRHRPARVNG